MHTAEPKLGCCNKNIWLLTFTTQSNSGSQCCLVTMAHYWPYLRGHKNVWRSPPPTPSTSSPPAFAQSFLQPHNNLRALISPLLRVASSQGPSTLYTPPNPAGAALRWVFSAQELLSLFIQKGGVRNMKTLEPSQKHNALVSVHTTCMQNTTDTTLVGVKWEAGRMQIACYETDR